MKGITSYLFGALALAAVGMVLLVWARTERELAAAERQIATFDYAGVDASLARAERLYAYASRVPFVGTDALNEVRARRAAVRYWQGDYAAIVPAQSDPIAGLPADNVALQFVVANAVYRNALAQARTQPRTQSKAQSTTPTAALQAIDSGIAAQLAVLKNSLRNEDAAFNYEYLLRFRTAVALKPADRRPTEEEEGEGDKKTTHGQPGGAPRKGEPADFKIHVPLEPQEFEDHKEGEQAGKAVVKERKG